MLGGMNCAQRRKGAVRLVLRQVVDIRPSADLDCALGRLLLGRDGRGRRHDRGRARRRALRARGHMRRAEREQEELERAETLMGEVKRRAGRLLQHAAGEGFRRLAARRNEHVDGVQAGAAQLGARGRKAPDDVLLVALGRLNPEVLASRGIVRRRCVALLAVHTGAAKQRDARVDEALDDIVMALEADAVGGGPGHQLAERARAQEVDGALRLG